MLHRSVTRKWLAGGCALGLLAGLFVSSASAQLSPEQLEKLKAAQAEAAQSGGKPKPDYPPHAEVLKEYEKVVSTIDGKPSLYNLYVRKKDGHVLAELPKNFASQKYFIALTVASGETYAGLQSGEVYAYWREYDKRLALLSPNISVRSTGDQESKDSVERLFTDTVLLDTPIVTMGPAGGPVIDLNQVLLGQASTFFGASAAGANTRLSKLNTAKAFAQNVEVAFELPARGGVLKSFHYSISLIPDNTGYKPREADARVGYFLTSFSDLGKYRDDKTQVRYINRWHLEKADANLAISPPKQPIVYYLEHTTPVRYRRWVREGVLMWNAAFEKVGISNAIEVYYQDKATGAHMEKDPEDVQYNFVRWLNNDVGTAIGPSRVHPLTGQILDADIILTDGWIRHYWNQYHEVMPDIAMEGFAPETLAWLQTRPQWDPRVRMAPPWQRQHLIQQRMIEGPQPFGGHAIGKVDARMIGDDEYDGLIGRHSQVNGMCKCADGLGMELAMLRMNLAMGLMDMADDPKEPMLDEVPEKFIGPLIAELVAHEVGHTLGLRHNFKASSIHSLSQINSAEVKGKKTLSGSVMDYIPVNFRVEAGEAQGDYTMISVGPYDMWAIEYGYTLEKDLKPILARVAEPELVYATDEDTMGPDPLARRYDFSTDPLDYAIDQMKLAKQHREKIMEKFVKDGDDWGKARRGYELTLGLQTRATSMMANWIGGTFVNRDKKGDPNGREPIVPVPVQQQRAALKFVVDNTFTDEAFGLSPKLLRHLSTDHFGGFGSEPSWPVHDRIMGIQASALTMVMNPTVLRRVYDNELRLEVEADALTLPEVLQTVTDAVWKELDAPAEGEFSARKPLISSLRRNLQTEHLDRLIDLTLTTNASAAAQKPLIDLAWMELERIGDKIERALNRPADPYTKAHLSNVMKQIEKAEEARFVISTVNPVINLGSLGGLFGQPQPTVPSVE